MALDTEVLERSETLNTILTGIEYYERSALLQLAPTLLAVSGAVLDRPAAELAEGDLRGKLKDLALRVFKDSPENLNTVDQALQKIELAYIRKNRR